MYCHNLLLDHPFVSPVNQGSLGGLPPLYIVRRRFLFPRPLHPLLPPSFFALVLLPLCLRRPERVRARADVPDLVSQSCGGSELLHDEIIHIAHKAANPSSYPPAQRIFEQYPSQKAHYEQDYPPTKVQLQVFDGGCHVATTLSVTSLAKYVRRPLSSLSSCTSRALNLGG